MMATHVDGWACPRCTLLNPVTTATCRVCLLRVETEGEAIANKQAILAVDARDLAVRKSQVESDMALAIATRQCDATEGGAQAVGPSQPTRLLGLLDDDDILSIILDATSIQDVAAFAQCSLARLHAASKYIRRLLTLLNLGPLTFAEPLSTTKLFARFLRANTLLSVPVLRCLRRPEKIAVLLALDILGQLIGSYDPEKDLGTGLGVQDGMLLMKICGPEIREYALTPPMSDICDMLVKHLGVIASVPPQQPLLQRTCARWACKHLNVPYTEKLIAKTAGLTETLRQCWKVIGAPNPALYLGPYRGQYRPREATWITHSTSDVRCLLEGARARARLAGSSF